MRDVVLEITLTLIGPIITAATPAGAFGMDVPFARDGAGNPFLPYSHVKGKVRESLETISPHIGITSSEITDWFGSESTNQCLPERGRMQFSDFVAFGGRSDVRHRICMDNERGAVRKGAYVVIEAPFGTGEEVPFRGTVRFACRDDAERNRIIDALHKAFRWTAAYGAMKSVGFGRIGNVAPPEIKEDRPAPAATASGSRTTLDRLALRLYPQAPFCLPDRRIGDNLFESETTISGGALKGALATTVNHMLGRPLDAPIDDSLPPPWTELGRCFSALLLTHAFPAPRHSADRPRQPPLSLVRESGTTHDVALVSGPGLIDGKAPAFSVDWKPSDFAAVMEAYGWGSKSPTRSLRVRTAINRDRRRVEEGKLFAHELVMPEGFVWHCAMDLSAIPEGVRPAVRTNIEILLGYGLKYLGKTKADLKVTFSDLPSPELSSPIDEATWVVTLQTPALMLNPSVSSDDGLHDTRFLLHKYREYWEEVSGKSLILERFFASEKLLGGYLHYRFQQGRPYNPFLLTAERSVFVLKEKDRGVSATAGEHLEKWLARGLPLPKWCHQDYDDSGSGATWRTCPFMPENGFGEIAVNMNDHKKPVNFEEL